MIIFIIECFLSFLVLVCLTDRAFSCFSCLSSLNQANPSEALGVGCSLNHVKVCVDFSKTTKRNELSLLFKIPWFPLKNINVIVFGTALAVFDFV